MTTVGDPADDDQTVGDVERLLRRVHPAQMVKDENQGRMRPSSAAFDDHEDGISVFLSSIVTDELGRPESDVLIGYERHSLVAVLAGEVRDETRVRPPLGVKRDPMPTDATHHPCAPAHALLVGLVRGKPGDKRQKKPLALSARLAAGPLIDGNPKGVG